MQISAPVLGKGVASETLELVSEYLLNDTNVEIITASTMPENKASANVLKKNGFKRILQSVYEDWGYPALTKADKWIKTNERIRHGYSFK